MNFTHLLTETTHYQSRFASLSCTGNHQNPSGFLIRLTQSIIDYLSCLHDDIANSWHKDTNNGANYGIQFHFNSELSHCESDGLWCILITALDNQLVLQPRHRRVYRQIDHRSIPF